MQMIKKVAPFFIICCVVIVVLILSFQLEKKRLTVDPTEASVTTALIDPDGDVYDKTMYVTFGFDFRFDENGREPVVQGDISRNPENPDNALKDMAKNFAPLQGPYIKVGVWTGTSYNRCTRGGQNFEFDPDFPRSITVPSPVWPTGTIPEPTPRGGLPWHNNEKTCEHNLNYELEQVANANTRGWVVPLYLQLGGYNWNDLGLNDARYDYNDALAITPAGPDSRGNTIQYPNNQWAVMGDTTTPFLYENTIIPYRDPATGAIGWSHPDGLVQGITFNYYNSRARSLRETNLRSATRRTVEKLNALGKPILAAISLDSDLNIAGWGGYGYRDYNPDTIRQFREWLTCAGPYVAGQPYHRWRRSSYTSNNPDPDAHIGRCFSDVSEINAVFSQNFSSYEAIQPPRLGSNTIPAINQWGNQGLWWKEWQRFRQHLVHMVVNESVNWIHAENIPLNRIFPHTPLNEYSPNHVMDYRLARDGAGNLSSNNDNFTTTIEGSSSLGGLGYMHYSNTEYRHNKPGEEGRPIFSVYKKMNPNWSNNEFYFGSAGEVNTTTPFPYQEAYDLFRDYYNYGQHTMMIQAWHTPGCGERWGGTPMTIDHNVAFRHCNAEEAFLNFLSLYRFLPRGTIAWEFGIGRSLKPPQSHIEYGIPPNPPQFDRSSFDGWGRVHHITNFRVQDGMLKGTLQGNDPFIHSPDWITHYGRANDKLIVKMKATPQGEPNPANVIAQVLWNTEDDSQMGANGKGDGIWITADGQWHEYVFNVGAKPQWNGKIIRQLRFDPSNSTDTNNALLEVEYVRICPYQEGGCTLPSQLTPIPNPTMHPSPTAQPSPTSMSSTPTPQPSGFLTITPTPISGLQVQVPTCIHPNTTGSIVEISWSRPGIASVDITRNTFFAQGFVTKSVAPYNTTFAPVGFSGNFQLQPDTTYKVRLRTGFRTSDPISFRIPACAQATN